MRYLNRLVLTALLALAMATSAFSADKTIAEADVPAYLQTTAVTVRANTGTGSGSLIVTKDGSVWVLTAAHVVEGNRVVRESNPGTKKTVVEFDDPKIMIVRIKDGRRVGELLLDTEVIRYSDAEYGHDLALLRVRDDDYKPKFSTVFYTEKDLPPLAERVLHCGSMLGSFGANSLAGGLISQHGRLIGTRIYDQSDTGVFPGSSGGPLVLAKDGRYIGMVVRGAQGGFTLFVPIRRMQKWADNNKLNFLFNDALDVPALDELRKGPIEDGDPPVGGTTSTRDAREQGFKTFVIPRARRVPLLDDILVD